MFEILNVKVPITRPPTPEQLLQKIYGKSTILIKARNGKYYGIVDGTYTLQWEEYTADNFNEDTMEEAISSMNMENITDRVAIHDAVEVWCDNECGTKE